MSRKFEMKKIQENIKSQVSFSKRRVSLVKRVDEIYVICDTNVAFLAFPPAGRINKFSSRDKYVNF